MRCDLIMKFDTMIPWSESMETTFIPKTSYQEKPSNSYALIYLVSPSSLRLSKSYFKKKTISCSCFNWYGLCKTFKVFSSCLLYCLILCIMFSWGDKFSGSFFHTSLYQLQLSIHEEWRTEDSWEVVPPCAHRNPRLHPDTLSDRYFNFIYYTISPIIFR